MTMRWQASVAVLCALVVGASACSRDHASEAAPVAAADASVDPQVYASQPNLFGNPYTAPTPAPSASASASASAGPTAKPSKSPSASATPSKSASAAPAKTTAAPKPSTTATKPATTIDLPGCDKVKSGFEGDLQSVKVVSKSEGKTTVKCTLDGTFLGQAVEVKVTFGIFTSSSAITSLAKAGCNGSVKKVSTGYKYSQGCDNTSGAAKSGLAVSDGALFAATTSELKSDLAVNADIRKITTDNNKRAAPEIMKQLAAL